MGSSTPLPHGTALLHVRLLWPGQAASATPGTHLRHSPKQPPGLACPLAVLVTWPGPGAHTALACSVTQIVAAHAGPGIGLNL